MVRNTRRILGAWGGFDRTRSGIDLYVTVYVGQDPFVRILIRIVVRPCNITEYGE